ncbi:MAG: DUF5060 domain-containing protein, partial [Armatimonadetes bacterium]|nr:DUF5060 domain-containing protein [Armatimonadota bacterium]
MRTATTSSAWRGFGVRLSILITFVFCVQFLAPWALAQQAGVTVDEHGIVQWSGAAGASLSALFLLVPPPGWQGPPLFSQENWQPASRREDPAKKQWSLAGPGPQDRPRLEVSQKVAVEGKRVRLTYRCKALEKLDTAGARLIVRAPTAAFAGKGEFIEGAGKLALAHGLPAQLPQPYHLGSFGEFSWLGWRLGDQVLTMRTPGQWCQVVSLQDDRQFKIQDFEAQLTIANTEHLQKGQEFTCELVLEPRTVAEIEAAGAKLVRAENKWAVAQVELASQGDLGLGAIEWSTRQGPRWRPVELRFAVSGTWDNPFDPEQIDVYARIHQPDGTVVRQPAFAYHDFEPLSAGGDLLLPKRGLQWRLRWTPQQEGTYRVQLVARSGEQRVSKNAGEFVCQGSEGHGFVRRCPDTPYYLRFDDGTPYFAVGENMCWDGDGLVEAYKKWFTRLGEAGGNYCRIWLVRWNMALEWTNLDGAARGHYYGLGKYSLDNAWRLDQVMRYAAEHGIYVMLCLGYHGELRDTADYFHAQCWAFNPYNSAVGGPCAKPQEFWTNDQARKLYKQRLRYYLARWGAYPNVLSWEFWNEVWAPAPWIKEMGEYVGEHDLHHHLRTTTYGRDDTWLLDEMDYSQAHHYGVDDTLRDSAPVIASTSWRFTQKFAKPFMMGEFGIDWKRSDYEHDRDGHATNMHNGMWAAVASRSFGTAALWYWDNYVDKLDLYDQFTPLARFAREVDWTHFKPTRPKVEECEPMGDVTDRWGPATVQLPYSWMAQPPQPVEVTHTGLLKAGTGKPSRLLFGPAKKDIQTPLKLAVDMPADGKLTLHVGTVSAKAELVVLVDGEERLRKAYKAGPPGEGPYKKTKYYDQWKLWQSQFDDELSVEVPAGRHVVALRNDDGDWVEVTRLTLDPYLDEAQPETYLLCDGRQAVGWLHDRQSNWQNDRDGLAPKERGPLRLIFSGLQ